MAADVYYQRATADSPMCLLRRIGATIERQDLQPGVAHHGLPVLLAGDEDEVGILQS